MDRKKELKQQFKETAAEGGVYQIVNNENGKVCIGTTRNFKTLNGQRFSLEMGTHRNKLLQAEWKQFGKEAFVFEVLEVLKKKEGSYFNEKEELAKLEEKWMEELQPYGERGYHSLRK